jgi:hypothetical protein
MTKLLTGFIVGILTMYFYTLHNPHVQYEYLGSGDTFTLQEVDDLLRPRDAQIHMLNNALKRKPTCPAIPKFSCDCNEEFNDGMMQGWKDCGAGL